MNAVVDRREKHREAETYECGQRLQGNIYHRGRRSHGMCIRNHVAYHVSHFFGAVAARRRNVNYYGGLEGASIAILVHS